jgi:hypothetical protein
LFRSCANVVSLLPTRRPIAQTFRCRCNTFLSICNFNSRLWAWSGRSTTTFAGLPFSSKVKFLIILWI